MINRIIIIVFIVFNAVPAQNRILVSINPGAYLYNSENGMHMFDDAKVNWAPGVSLGYERDNLLGYKIRMDYNFTYSDKLKIMVFERKDDQSEISTYSWVNYFLTSHNYDAAVVLKSSGNINYYLGPSLAIYSRTIEYISPIYSDLYAPKIYDKLVTYCIGANAAINLFYTANKKGNYPFFYTGLKFRFLHSLYIDKRGRNTDNYYQNYLTVQLNMGVGYNF